MAKVAPQGHREKDVQKEKRTGNLESSDSDESDENVYWPPQLINLRSPINILAPMFWCSKNGKVLEEFKKFMSGGQEEAKREPTEDVDESKRTDSLSVNSKQSSKAQEDKKLVSSNKNICSQERFTSRKIVLTSADIASLKGLRDFEMTELAALTSRLSFSMEDRKQLDQVSNLVTKKCNTMSL